MKNNVMKTIESLVLIKNNMDKEASEEDVHRHVNQYVHTQINDRIRPEAMKFNKATIQALDGVVLPVVYSEYFDTIDAFLDSDEKESVKLATVQVFAGQMVDGAVDTLATAKDNGIQNREFEAVCTQAIEFLKGFEQFTINVDDFAKSTIKNINTEKRGN